MKETYSEKLFEFTNSFQANPLSFEYVALYQFGETCLERGASIEDHVQICDEISFVVSGCGYFGTEHTEEKLKVGDVHIVSEGQTHRIRAEAGTELRYFHFAFKFNENAANTGLEDVVDFYRSSPVGFVHDTGELRTLFSMLVDEFFTKPKYSLIVIDSIIKQILIYVWRMYADTQKTRFVPTKNKNAIGETVYAILRYIDSHVCEISSVREIAERFSYSSNYISHLVKCKTGMSLQQYIQNERIEYAKKLLRDKKSTITEISSVLNYDSSQAFSKMFKKQTGMRPGEYRALIQEHSDS